MDDCRAVPELLDAKDVIDDIGVIELELLERLYRQAETLRLKEHPIKSLLLAELVTGAQDTEKVDQLISEARQGRPFAYEALLELRSCPSSRPISSATGAGFYDLGTAGWSTDSWDSEKISSTA